VNEREHREEKNDKSESEWRVLYRSVKVIQCQIEKWKSIYRKTVPKKLAKK